MRGEHQGVIVLTFGILGSSPHAWGTRGKFGLEHSLVRFIPTCVGNPHLHRGGGTCMCGSSPHAWGTPSRIVYELIDMRFIPTCVGNTSCPWRRVRDQSVHPHMRGEHLSLTHQVSDTSGSS